MYARAMWDDALGFVYACAHRYRRVQVEAPTVAQSLLAAAPGPSASAADRPALAFTAKSRPDMSKSQRTLSLSASSAEGGDDAAPVSRTT
jgi:hypothetical protein